MLRFSNLKQKKRTANIAHQHWNSLNRFGDSIGQQFNFNMMFIQPPRQQHHGQQQQTIRFEGRMQDDRNTQGNEHA